MSEEDKSSKTEAPTERKLRQARRKGDVPSSREVTNLMAVFSLFALTVFLLPTLATKLTGTLSGLFSSAGQVEIGEGGQGLNDVIWLVGGVARSLATALGPAVLLMVVAAIFGVLIQGETVVSADRIRPKLSKISPLAGFKRLFSIDSFVEFLKNVAKVLVVGTIAIYLTQDRVREIWQTPGFVPEALPAYLRDAVSSVLIATTLFLAPVAISDILWKRFQWRKRQRMSLQEVRDEHKETEGDPHIKARRSSIQRQRARQRIAVAVPTASIILTNPTHYAVALRYELGRDAAPVCVAKGTDLIAQQIRKIGREHEVPVIENKPLARALHAVVEVDEQIPVEHWQAVAEIIGYVIDLKRNIRRKAPPGSALRDEP